MKRLDFHSCLQQCYLCNSMLKTLGMVSGTVKDKNTQEELIGVAIQFFGPDTLGVVTDEMVLFYQNTSRKI